MAVEVYPNANEAAARHVDTIKGVREQNKKVEAAAIRNLANTKHTPRIAEAKDPADIYFPAEIETKEEGSLAWTILHAPDAMALEFGHAPSGYFKDKPSKAPEATYILTRAAYG